MDQFVNVLLTIGRPGLEAQQSHSLCLEYLWQLINIFTRCTYRYHIDILMTAVADVRKGSMSMGGTPLEH